jgi:hypothetical protein
MNSSPAPYPLAMVVCDAIWRDPATGKHFILGCFSAIGAAQFPVVHPRLAVYLAITEGYGTVPIRLRLVTAEAATVLHETEPMPVEFSDPLAIAEVAVQLANLSFAAPGQYRLQLHAGTHFLMERRILVQQVQPPPR